MIELAQLYVDFDKVFFFQMIQDRKELPLHQSEIKIRIHMVCQQNLVTSFEHPSVVRCVASLVELVQKKAFNLALRIHLMILDPLFMR
jgi:hypothetical protein